MDKRQLINLLFILSFPVYGLGTWVSASISPSAGYLVSLTFHLLILVFYFIDLAYRREIIFRLNGVYLLMVLYILSSAGSLIIAYYKGLPEINMGMIVVRTMLLLVPFHSFIVFTLYNDRHKDEIPMLLIKGLSFLLLINLFGYFVLRLSNEQHSIDGRLNMPFLDGFYSGASVLAVLNLLIAYRIRANKDRALESMGLTVFFLANMALLYMINSRLAMMIFLVVFFLFLVRLVSMRGLHFISLFFIPILLSCAFILYEILTLPGMSSIMQRVDVEDVMTFNGRAFLWKDGLDWLADSREGLILGNGYKGHFFLDMITDVAEMWNTDEVFHLHMHSTSLEVLVCQGLVAYLIFCFLTFSVFRFYGKKFKEGSGEGAFVAPVVYLLFILQVDTFVYMDGLGFVLLALLVSRVSVTEQEVPAKMGKPGRRYASDVYETRTLTTYNS